MDYTVYTHKYEKPLWNFKEISRYAGVKEKFYVDEKGVHCENIGNTDVTMKLIWECVEEAEPQLRYDVVFTTVPVNIIMPENDIDFGFMRTHSYDLYKYLRGKKEAIIFCATVGIGIDRLIAKYQALSPAKAVIMQAIGAERIESLCDLFTYDVLGGCKRIPPRFSPGYGDFDIEAQRHIFTLLDPPRRIGVGLNKSLLMSPTKSVTAVVRKA